jgi:hypothetical protein
MLDFIMTKIPFNGDLNENETVLKFAFNLYSLQKDKIEKYMPNITLTCLKVLIDEKCDEIPDSFKFEVGKFIRNCVMSSGEQNVSTLREFESKMSQFEKESLAKYLA